MPSGEVRITSRSAGDECAVSNVTSTHSISVTVSSSVTDEVKPVGLPSGIIWLTWIWPLPVVTSAETFSQPYANCTAASASMAPNP